MAGVEDRYDTIGATYARRRREDPYIARHIHEALGEAWSLVNIGAGTGNYEPTHMDVVAVEPSIQMIAQRIGRPAPAVRAVAEALPFPAASFDVAMAVITLHHWSDPAAGLREMARVAGRQVVVYFEPLQTGKFWALDYFPASVALPTVQDPPGELFLREHLRVHEIRTVLVPRDCVDGFGVAFWARPEEILDPAIQAGMSWLAMLPSSEREGGTARLRADLQSGEWDRRHGYLRNESFYDGGYRIALASS